MKNCNGYSSCRPEASEVIPLAIWMSQMQWVDLGHRGLAFLTPAKLFLNNRNLVQVFWHYKYKCRVSGMIWVANPLFGVPP